MNRVKEVIEIGKDGEIKSPSHVRRERTEKFLANLSQWECFDRNKMLEEFLKESPELSEAAFKYRLQKLLKEGIIERIGRNKYCIASQEKAFYEHNYSKRAKELALKIVGNFTYVEFRIFEPLQVFELIDDGYDSDVMFVFIDADYLSYAKDVLSEFYPEMVLLKPDSEEFNGKIIYEKPDGWIVLNSLVSEAPRGRGRLWHTDLEKMAADLISDKVLHSLWSDSQLAALFETIFEKYHVDESKMLRYARRRKGAEKLINFVKENTNIKFKTV